MSIVRVVYKLDKSVAVLHYAPKSMHPSNQAFDRMMERSSLAGLEYEDIDSSQLPQSREYRNAWEKEKGKVFKINQGKKNEIDEKKNKKSLEERIVALEAKEAS